MYACTLQALIFPFQEQFTELNIPRPNIAMYCLKVSDILLNALCFLIPIFDSDVSTNLKS